MKSSQLIEYNMRNIILENSYKKCVGETGPGKLKLSIYPWINSLKFYSLFLFYHKLSAIEIYWNYCFYLILSIFKKLTKVWN